jgi:hypothetical protein
MLRVSQMSGFGVSGGVPIQYVGGTTIQQVGIVQNPVLKSYSLTGGLASTPSAGDLLIYGACLGNGSNYAFGNPGSNNFTLLSDQYVNESTGDTNLAVYYKFLEGGNDLTELYLSTTGNIDMASVYAIQVFRNVDPTVFDTAHVEATGLNTANANPPAIITVTPGAVVVAIGSHGGDPSSSNFNNPGDLTNFITTDQSETNAGTSIGMGYNTVNVPDTFNPTGWGYGGGDSVFYGWAAVTLALRPAWPGKFE